jgi:hypothetical protein
MRSILADTEGDIWCGTLSAIGRYWRDVLSERTRCIDVQTINDRVQLINTAGRAIEGIPVEVTLNSGRRFMRLVDAEADSTIDVFALNKA